MSDKKSWDGRFSGESNEMFEWRQGVNYALATLAHIIRLMPEADTEEMDKALDHLRDNVAPKGEGSIERAAFMLPILCLKHMQQYTREGEAILKDTRKKS